MALTAKDKCLITSVIATPLAMFLPTFFSAIETDPAKSIVEDLHALHAAQLAYVEPQLRRAAAQRSAQETSVLAADNGDTEELQICLNPGLTPVNAREGVRYATRPATAASCTQPERSLALSYVAELYDGEALRTTYVLEAEVVDGNLALRPPVRMLLPQ